LDRERRAEVAAAVIEETTKVDKLPLPELPPMVFSEPPEDPRWIDWATHGKAEYRDEYPIQEVR
jgi:hypothetical protein